jgi:hypothetical protein
MFGMRFGCWETRSSILILDVSIFHIERETYKKLSVLTNGGFTNGSTVVEVN